MSDREQMTVEHLKGMLKGIPDEALVSMFVIKIHKSGAGSMFLSPRPVVNVLHLWENDESSKVIGVRIVGEEIE